MPPIKILGSILVASFALVWCQSVRAQTESSLRCGFALNDVGTTVIKEGGYLEKFERVKVSGKSTMRVLFTSSRNTDPTTVWNNKRIMQHPRLRNLAVAIFRGCDDVETVLFRTLEDGNSKVFNRYN
jgi:hypothetical protein